MELLRGPLAASPTLLLSSPVLTAKWEAPVLPGPGHSLPCDLQPMLPEVLQGGLTESSSCPFISHTASTNPLLVS